MGQMWAGEKWSWAAWGGWGAARDAGNAVHDKGRHKLSILISVEILKDQGSPAT